MAAIPNFSIRDRSVWPLMAGLVVAQAIATLFVRRSNLDLRRGIAAIDAAGWLSVPAGPAVDTLDGWGPALGGGLFFTLSIGIGLALATWAILYLWQRFFPSRRALLWLPAGCWLALVVAVNASGWVLFPTLFVVGVPLATALAAIQAAPVASAGRAGKLWPVPLLSLLLLTGVWATQWNQQLFVTIRDHLLLSNTFGRSVNDFYYRYTLHAAECFKSFGQKTVRTGRWDAPADADSARRWTRALAEQDVVMIPGLQPADVTVRASGGGRLTLASPAGDRLEVSPADFLADPNRWLRRFSEAGDRYAPFRRFTFVGLLLGFPILLYVVVDGAIGRLAGLFMRAPGLIWMRAAICLAIGLLLFIPMLAGRTNPLTPGNLGAALAADPWPQRVAALRQIEKGRVDLAVYPQYRTLLTSPLVVERYWVARALTHSRDGATRNDLLALIRDSNPNVVCQAYYALGERGDRSAVTSMRERMLQSDHWYTQWYAYRAMRRLGWHQTPSESVP
ncbi:MAG: HEAT repeat domain-containing protein [Desulfatitalea sp.]